MSIEITYRKAVVKLQDGRTIPILETWSNNCWELPTREHPKGRRERWRGILTWLCGTKESIEKEVKSRVKRIIENNEKEDYKQRTDRNRKDMDSWYRASWRFPWNLNLWKVIGYVSRPNIDLDIADEHIKLYRYEDKENAVKPSEIDKLHLDRWGWIYASGVDNALIEQKIRKDKYKAEHPSTPKPKGNRTIKLYDSYVMKLTARSLVYTRYESWAKRFQTEKQAQSRGEKYLKTRFSSVDYGVVLLDNQTA